MKRNITTPTLLALFIGLAPLASPAMAYADTTGPPAQAPLLITEVQTGSAASASEEFIELYNTGTAAIDLDAHDWQLEVAGSTATDWATPLRTIPLSGSIAPGQSYVVASQFSDAGQIVRYLPGTAQAWFSAGLSAAAGHIRLTYTTNQPQSDNTCSGVQTVVDELEWSAPKNGGAATPSIDSRSVLLTTKNTGVPGGSSLQRLVDPALHTYVDTDTDSTDFMVSASSTPADSNVLVGTAAPGTAQPAVPLPTDGCTLSPPSSPPVDSPPTQNPGDNPGSDQPPAEPTLPAADQGLLMPQISELLPNPAPPQNDATDEFIELYNPNDAPFDVSGFVLQSGTTTTHNYTFPDGTLLAPKAFRAFFSADTGLSLSNSGGQVKLTDPAGNIVAQTDVYGTAKDGQSWILAAGTWQWTTSPTPNAANAVGAAVATTTKTATAAKPAAKKSPAVKAATTKKSTGSKAKPATDQALAASAITSKTPLHPAILAGIGALAVLYGAYEYRHDMANYIRRLRDNRAARRENRQALTRRRSDRAGK